MALIMGKRLSRIVLLPGLLCDESIWDAQKRALVPYAEVLVADLSACTSIREMAESALAMAESRITVIGHSMGARVALEMARIAPDRVCRLGLLDTGVHPRREEEVARRRQLVELAFSQGMKALAEQWLPLMVHPDRTRDRVLMDSLAAMVMRATPEQHRRQIQALLDRPDARNYLPEITCPTLVMVGHEDQWSPLAQHEEIAASIPDAQLVVIENSGHMSPVEQPEQVNAALLRWLGFSRGKLQGHRPCHDAPGSRGA